jgi:dsRNA-specific ribonuclease
MPYDSLLHDLQKDITPKRIGTDKGLAKLGDALINLAYSMAKSIYLSKISESKNVIRTGMKVSREVLSKSLKDAHLKNFSKSRADAHDMADTVEAIIAYVWLDDKVSLEEIIDLLLKSLKGNLEDRKQEILAARSAFTQLLCHVKQFLPEE